MGMENEDPGIISLRNRLLTFEDGGQLETRRSSLSVLVPPQKSSDWALLKFEFLFHPLAGDFFFWVY